MEDSILFSFCCLPLLYSAKGLEFSLELFLLLLFVLVLGLGQKHTDVVGL